MPNPGDTLFRAELGRTYRYRVVEVRGEHVVCRKSLHPLGRPWETAAPVEVWRGWEGERDAAR